MNPRIAGVPYRGLRCRELSCQKPLIMVTTTRGRQMPLEQKIVELKPGDDERGLYVVVRDSVDLAAKAQDASDGRFVPASTPIAVTLQAARELGLEIPSFVYRAHWAGCTKADRFRR